MGFGVWGLGFQISGFGFQVSDFEFRVSNFGFRISGVGSKVSRVRLSQRFLRAFACGIKFCRFGVQGSGVRVQDVEFGFLD